MDREPLEKELCEIVELISMLEHICSNTSESTLPSAGIQLTLIQARKKLQQVISVLFAEDREEESRNMYALPANRLLQKPIFSTKQHGIPLSERIRKMPINKERAARVRELLVSQDEDEKEVINW